MAERKFADEEVIKALEFCIQNSECEYCEYREKTDKSDICPIRMDALNLINKQNAEMETLKDNTEHLAVMLEEAKSKVERLQTELKLLTENSISAKYPCCVSVSNGVILTKSWEEYDRLIGDISNAEEIRIELASEIFAEIESKKMFLKDCVGNMGVVVLFKDISELEKKYTEGKQ